MKRIRVHSVEQYVQEIGPLMQKGLDMYRADVPEEGLLGVGFAPGCEIELVQRRPAFVIESGETRLALDASVARGIYVQRLA